MAIKVSAGGGGAELIARLPLLGPLIGWTRRTDAGVCRRLWIKADDYDGQPAVAAMTARWLNGAVVPGSVELWEIRTAGLPETDPPAEERFAIADLDSRANQGGVLRMVTLHVRRAASYSPPKVRSLDDSGDGADADAFPRARRLHPAKLFRRATSASEVDDLANALLRDLETRLLHGRRPTEPGAPRPRHKERTARIELCEVELRSQREPDEAALRFAAGCCRHPGMNFDRQRADRALAALACRAAQLDFGLMLGDQIYADATAGVIDAQDRLEKYTSRYYEAFDSPGFRRLARRLPLYMAADDHEIRDNWPKDAVPPGAAEAARALATCGERWAGELFYAHQRSHGPDHPAWAPPGHGTKFWYAFEAAGLPFFCFDTRFERLRDPDRLMQPYQLDAFRAWLTHACTAAAAAPKFVLSGSVFAPTEREYAGQPLYGRRADTWVGYASERGAVLQEILAQRAQNVVFVSGDLHCGALASLQFANAKHLRCYSVVAPPFYAPFPFANLPACEVAGSEKIEFDQGSGPRQTVVCSATSFAAGGFAVLNVVPPKTGNPLDWEIQVDYYRDEWRDGRVDARLERSGKLAGGIAT